MLIIACYNKHTSTRQLQLQTFIHYTNRERCEYLNISSF